MERSDTLLTLKDHIVICNCNPKVGKIIQEIYADSLEHHVVLIIQDQKLWERHPKWHPVGIPEHYFHTIVGSPFERQTLKKGAIDCAQAAIILADPNEGELADATSTLVAINIEQESPEVHTVMELLLSINRKHLHSMNVDEVVCLGEISEKLIAQSCISPGIKKIFGSLLSANHNTSRIFTPTIPQELVDTTFRDLAKKTIKNNLPFMIIGFIQQEESSVSHHQLLATNMRTLKINPRKEQKDHPLKRKDQLIIIASSPPDLTPLISANQTDIPGKFDLMI